MSHWMTGEAKQNLSEVIRRCGDRPQRIFNRNRLVAAVISAEAFERFERWQHAQDAKTLGDAFDEVRELCSEYDYELEIEDRRDREVWVENPSDR